MSWAGRDPRAKVFLAVVVSFALAAAPGGRVLLVLPAALLLAATAGLDARRALVLARAVLLLWGLSFLANAFFLPGERLGPEALGWLRPTREGLGAGLVQGARLAALTAVAAWMAGTTSLFAFAASLEWSVRRWPRFRARVHRSLLPTVLALRLLPSLLDEGRRLLDVDRLRRGPRRGAAGVRRTAALVPLWVAMVVDRADALALALTVRGYRSDRARGFAREFRLGPGDLVLAAGATGVVFFLGAR